MSQDTSVLPIILASGSPRRRELMQALGMEFEIVAADVDERSLGFHTPREFALKAAYVKACAVEERLERAGLIVAADTIVVLEGKIFGKPADPEEARQMLAQLSGREHSVISGIAVKEFHKSVLLDSVATRVFFRRLTPKQIADYVATGEPLDKAGAYAIQGKAARLVERIEGDYFNVVGLPLRRLLEMMSMYTDVSAYKEKLAELERQ